jgi:TetR/AcrR family transcriptional repressor of nem operon
MRVSREKMADNRVQLINAASRLFRERGFDAVTVADVANAAGLTHGAFYGYFDSKEDLIARAMEAALATPPIDPKATTLADVAVSYLSAKHRESSAYGCVYAAVAGEAIRSTDDTRHVMTEGLMRQLAKLEPLSPGRTANDRRRSAITGLSAMVGALMLSRVVDDPTLSDELLMQTRAALRDFSIP